jgi:hypothetical protein
MRHDPDCNVTLGFRKGEIYNCHGVSPYNLSRLSHERLDALATNRPDLRSAIEDELNERQAAEEYMREMELEWDSLLDSRDDPSLEGSRL